jgi:hypothetical protein
MLDDAADDGFRASTALTNRDESSARIASCMPLRVCYSIASFARFRVADRSRRLPRRRSGAQAQTRPSHRRTCELTMLTELVTARLAPR